MKLINIPLFIVTLGTLEALRLPIPLVNIDLDIDTKFLDFQKKFKKSYKTVEELNKRLKIFTENVIEFAAYNVLHTLGQVTHTRGINQFSDWTNEEFMEYVNKGLNYKRKPARVSRSTRAQNYSLPSSVDWRKKGVVTAIKDQGSCGSCYAFSSAGVLESHLKIANGTLISLSEQHLIDCSDAQNNDGCDGGLVSNSFDFVKLNGIKSEKDYPYRDEAGDCRYSQSPAVTTVKGYVEIKQSDEQELQYILATKGPVSVAIDATFELQAYESGILDDKFCTTYELNHAVVLVGYGVENGLEYYILKNSWGDYWGENGYFRMVRNKNNRCGIATMAVYPLM